MEKRSENLIFVCDDKELRRAGLTVFLEDWSEENNLKTLGVGLADPMRILESDRCLLCILNVGGDFDHTRLGATMQLLTAIPTAPPIAVISDSDRLDLGYLVFQHGGAAFITTRMQPSVVFSALSFLLKGGTYYPPEMLLQSSAPSYVRPRDEEPIAVDSPGEELSPKSVTECSIRSVASPAEPKFVMNPEIEAQALTDRQLAVLKHLSHGKSNKEIARVLDVSESTIKVHVRQVMRRLNVTNRTQAALAAASQASFVTYSIPNKDFPGHSSMNKLSGAVRCAV